MSSVAVSISECGRSKDISRGRSHLSAVPTVVIVGTPRDGAVLPLMTIATPAVATGRKGRQRSAKVVSDEGTLPMPSNVFQCAPCLPLAITLLIASSTADHCSIVMLQASFAKWIATSLSLVSAILHRDRIDATRADSIPKLARGAAPWIPGKACPALHPEPSSNRRNARVVHWTARTSGRSAV